MECDGPGWPLSWVEEHSMRAFFASSLAVLVAAMPAHAQGKVKDAQTRVAGTQPAAKPQKKESAGKQVVRKVKEAGHTEGEGGGAVSEKERQAVDEKTRARQLRIRAKLDTSGDGKISETEWQAVSEDWKDFDAELDRSLKSMDGRGRAALMKSIDTNGDGQLDSQERAVLRDRAEQARLEMINRFDADGDGRVVGDERRALNEALSAVKAKVLAERPRQAERKGDGKVEQRGASGAAEPTGARPQKK
jgi:hypothetical protein